MTRIEVAAAAEGVIALVSAACARIDDATQSVMPQQLGEHLADRASADPFVSETLAVASSIIVASQKRQPSATISSADRIGAHHTWAVDNLPLFTYEDPDGTVRALC
jgi:hypothetical protein